eukprot:907647-Pleurochrysis_carterae.AAC.2
MIMCTSHPHLTVGDRMNNPRNHTVPCRFTLPGQLWTIARFGAGRRVAVCAALAVCCARLGRRRSESRGGDWDAEGMCAQKGCSKANG